MKKYILVLALILLCIIAADSQRVGAYSVKVQENGMYAEALPDSIVKNAPAFFRKHVEKTMKYHNKYKDADEYTYRSEVPTKYLDFIPIAKKIQDSDEIILKNPFFIYEIGGNGDYRYYFTAEKNGKKLCLFYIAIDPYTGKAVFGYQKAMDQYFAYDEKTTEDALFYRMDGITYAETPEETREVRNQKTAGEIEMGGDASLEEKIEEFQKKNYEEKKKEIFDYLTEIKKEKLMKKTDKNLKLELQEEYIESEQATEENGKGIYVAVGVLAVVGIAVGIKLGKRRKNA